MTSYSSSSFFGYRAEMLSTAMGDARIASMVIVSDIQDFGVTELEVPEVASLIVPIHGISEEATPTIQSSNTGSTGFPFASTRPPP